MRRLLISGFALVLIAPAVQAGLYIPDESLEMTIDDGKAQALPFDAFRVKLQDIRSVSGKNRYLAKRDALMAKGMNSLTVSELIALSGYQIRLGDLSPALETLQRARVRDHENFLVESHLALRAFRVNESGAVSHQSGALLLKPKELPGMTPEQLAWNLKMERVLLELMKARLKEQGEKGPRFEPKSLDALFPVQFGGEGGTYEAGRIADSQKANLPPDAIATVQQLLFWLPQDTRLYWLLGELYNANGDMESAAKIFDECVDSLRFQADLLRAHRQIINTELARRQEERAAEQARQEELQKQQIERDKQSDWRNHPEVFWVLGGIAAVPLMLLMFWQVRVLRKRLHGDCPTGH